MTTQPPSSVVRHYVRTILSAGHAALLARAPASDLDVLAGALASVGAIGSLSILREAIYIDRASRDEQGRPFRDYLECEEQAMLRLDRELYRELPALEHLLLSRDDRSDTSRSASGA